ncbi:hypothetical protein ACFVHI_07440 [Kitasatospora sp. NPDC127121]|uniref:hypothetical protein n=1 Tax=Kitasatospora sp. NPDC127121 TaxID=3345371 RepID=UPI00363A571F
MDDTYEAVPEPPLSPPGTTLATLQPLANALNALGHPVADVLDDVTAGMVELAFNSLSPKERQRLLGKLGIKLAAPRRAGKALCRDMLSRMQRDARQRRCHCAVKALTYRVMSDVSAAADPSSGIVTDPVTRWGDTLVRLAMLSWCSASAVGARVLVWAAERDWLGYEAEQQLLDAVRAAADDVVEATPGFSLYDQTDAPVPAQGEFAEPAAPCSPEEAAGQPAAATDGPTQGGTLDVAATHQALELVFQSAQEASRRIGTALDTGYPPAEEDIRALTVLTDTFRQFRDGLAEAGVQKVPDQLDDLAESVRSYLDDRRRDREARAALLELLTITCPERSPASGGLEAAHGLARAILDSPRWGDTERAEAATLGALVELVRLREQPDHPAEIMSRQQRIGAALPTCAGAALLYTELSLPEEPVLPQELPFPRQADAAPQAVTTPAREPGPDPTPVVPAATAVPSEARSPVPVPETPPATVEQPIPPAVGYRSEQVASARAATVPEAEPAVAPAVPAPVRADAEVSAAITRLVAERRFGLAFHLARAVGRPEPEQASLRLAAAGAALKPGTVGGPQAFLKALLRCETLETKTFENTELLALPALLRASLSTGEYAAGAQLKALAVRLPDGLATLAVAVADPTLSGALALTKPLSGTADVSESESRLRDVVQQARDLLKPPRLRFNRATTIAKRWLAPDGLLGSVLHALSEDSPEAGSRAREAVDRLSRLTDIQSEIDRMDRGLRASSNRVLQGSGRQDLVHLVERTTDCAKSWIDATEAIRRGRTAETDWARQETAAMRQTLLDGCRQALEDLDKLRGRSPGSLASASAWAAHESLSALLDEIEQGPARLRRFPGLDAHQTIDAELLKIPLATGEQPTVSALLAAQDRTWEEALALQEGQDVFSTAHRILDLAEQGSLPGKPISFPPARRTELFEAEERRRETLLARHTDLVAELRRAQADGALTDDQDLSLQELLSDAQPHAEEDGKRELILVRRTLDQVAKLLPRFRGEAAERLRSRLDALPEVSDEDHAQVLRHLETDGLATAADLVYFLELGETVPEIVSGVSHLAGFFPSVPDGLRSGITAELIRSVRDHGKHPDIPALDYTRLSADEADRAAKALEIWKALGATPPKGRQSADPRQMLLPALNLLGYEAKQALPLNGLPRSVEYRFVDVLDIEINGRAWAPVFGSKILEQAGRLRVLMIWGRPSAQLLLSRVSQEPSKESLLVAYFGTLDSKARTELAAASVDIAPLMVVDDAALAYLAAHGNRQVSVATETLLPFSGVNPYIREKRGRIGREMFYGRDAERKRILDPDGTQIIFGGRGLGKSALLNDAGDRFAEQQRDYHQKLYLNLDHHNIGKGTALGAETIWGVLDRELTDQKVLGKPRRKAEADPYERVRAGIKQWLDAEPRRRLLILMDECDRFFEADVPHCTETRRLRGLCTETPGRMKVVFAGLHSVQRFTRLARNGPFSHLAQTPTVVGPLAPQFAADLLVDPMRALGFEFVDVDLVNRVLGYCSYQPFLLQMFGSRLVEVMQQRRSRGDAGSPPYAISVTDVEAVESDPSLRADITAAFKDTLTLDDRYDMIANVLARHARDNGLETRLSDAELRDECASWWPDGFAGLDSEGFRAYLQEMVGLGILAPNHDGRGWHLRGPNALRMIGTAQEVENRLLTAAAECELEETIALESRPELPDKRTAPLTVTQVDDLLAGRTNQTRVVFGTPATGIGDVERTLRSVTDRVGGWSLPPIGRPSVFRQALTEGLPGTRRVIVSDLAAKMTSNDTCRDAVVFARTLLPERTDVTRAVVLIVGLHQLQLWRELLTDPVEGDSIAVFLRRHDQRSLRAWAQHTDLFTAERVTRLLELTGGWPALLDRAISLHNHSGNEDEALNRLRDDLQQKAFVEEFLDDVGLTTDPLIGDGYRAVAKEFGAEWADEADILTAIELAGLEVPDAEWVLTCLEALQAFDRNGGRMRLEPVLHNCWSRL